MPARLDAPAGFAGEFRTDEPTRQRYSEGAGPLRIVPAAVAVPAGVEDLALLARHALGTGTPLIPRGAGSGMPGGNIGPHIVVELRRLSHAIEVHPARRATAGASATWQQLDDVIRPHGLRFPPDPSSRAFCTLGGMAATNAAGPNSLRYGSTRHWIRSMEIVTADGEVAWLHRGDTGARDAWPQAIRRFRRDALPAIMRAREVIFARFPPVSKNSSGYALDEFLRTRDFLDLVAGSEGTLAFITRLELQLAPLPASTGTALVSLPDLESLGEAVSFLRSLDPAAVELLDRSYLELAGGAGTPIDIGSAEALLLVLFEETGREQLRSVLDRLERGVVTLGGRSALAIEPQAAERLWALRHAASPALAALPATTRSLQVIEDGCVPVERLVAYVRGVRAAARDAGVRIVAFGHAGDGHLHVNALADTTEPDFAARLVRLHDTVTELLVSLHGTPAGEHGDGRLRTPLLARFYGSEIMRLFELVKRAFDPAGIMNPGIKVPAPDIAWQNVLKAGPGAEPIDPLIEAELREIERTAAWSRLGVSVPSRSPSPGNAPR